jgi:phosphomannomutase
MELKQLQNGSDIRGIAMEGIQGQSVNLTPEAVYLLARGFESWLKEKTQKDKVKIAVGHDSRLSADILQQAIMDGLVFDGANVLDCDLASTPSMFMACIFDEFDADGSIMITASHLPFNRNGMKFFYKGGGLDKEDVAAIIEKAENEAFLGGKDGTIEKVDLMKVYSAHLVHLIKEGVNAKEYDKPLSDLHIVVDAGNGAGGFYVDQVLEPLGANTSGSQFLEPDGHFPNHIPNPEDKEAMESICSAVKENKADLGIIFDTDVDRSAAVDENGNPISRNAIVALASVLAAENHEGTTVVTDSVTSDELNAFLKSKGINHLRFRRGYKNVINKGLKLNRQGIDCQLAIETSGHAAFKENYFLDDGAFLATKIIIQAAKSSISDLISELKHPLESKEIRAGILEEDFKTYGAKVIEEFKNYTQRFGYITPAKDNYEGWRINFDKEHGDGWILMRLSLHEPLLPINIESKSQGGVEKMEAWLKKFLDRYNLDKKSY